MWITEALPGMVVLLVLLVQLEMIQFFVRLEVRAAHDVVMGELTEISRRQAAVLRSRVTVEE